MSISHIISIMPPCRLKKPFCLLGAMTLQVFLAGAVYAQDMVQTLVASEAGGSLAAAAADAAIASEAAATRHTLEVGGATANISNDSPNWRDMYIKGVHHFDGNGVLQWQVDSQKHYGERGTSGAISYTRDISPDWYFSIGASSGSASFMSRVRADVGLYYKWLASRQLVTGITGMWSKSGDGVHRDRAVGLNAAYYFSDLPLVLQGGVTANESDPGSVTTNRWFGAVTYGRDKAYYLTLRHEAGREGYLPAGANAGAAVDFSSRVTNLSWRHWISPKFGYVVGGEYYVNPYYHRKGLNAGLFYHF